MLQRNSCSIETGVDQLAKTIDSKRFDGSCDLRVNFRYVSQYLFFTTVHYLFEQKVHFIAGKTDTFHRYDDSVFTIKMKITESLF